MRDSVRREFSAPAEIADESLNAAVQLVGSSQLSGWAISRALLVKAPLDRIGSLPSVIQHRPEAVVVELWQRQLWLGLRAVASIDPRRLFVEPQVIKRSLEL